MATRTETLAALLERYASDNDQPRPIPRVRFDEARARGDDPLHILPYLADIGIAVCCLDDLLLVNADEAEEEIQTFRVEEGVAVVMASTGLWLLFEGSAP